MNYQETRFNGRPKMYQKDVQILNELESRLEVVISKHFPKGAFMRLCGRSPKDAEPLQRDAVYQKYQQELKDLVEKQGAELNALTKLRAIARVNYLGVHTGKDAMSLLLTSERVFTDLHDWIKWGEPDQVVFRQWEPELTLEYEFRGFVYKGKLNAISQYDHYAIYPDLESLKEKIQAKIFELWQEVHSHIKVDSYCIDFAYLPKSEKVMVVEISPFLNCTGPALFKWDRDGDLLRNGPFEFRLNSFVRPHLEEIVETNWELRWTEKVPPYWEFYDKAKPDEGGSNSKGALTHFFKKLTTGPDASKYLLFVYGTLREGYHWNSKFLSTCRKVCDAKTDEKYPLVVGKSCVPYLLGDLPNTGHQIIGEVWEVDEVSLQNLDEYEGIGKGYYSRRTIPVTSKNGKQKLHADVYFKTESSPELRASPFLPEYSLDFHLKNYNAIMHIMVKQQLYMGDITWGFDTNNDDTARAGKDVGSSSAQNGTKEDKPDIFRLDSRLLDAVKGASEFNAAEALELSSILHKVLLHKLGDEVEGFHGLDLINKLRSLKDRVQNI
eukprot:Phypoly_transcript_05824.p1 GENE.Phypoly_transcript_05824~~Phypoly_transcript_05824.p1  ORF type:complete len:588 (+),score=94.49 Phypoly_transcript_05824:110-1765(+)